VFLLWKESWRSGCWCILPLRGLATRSDQRTSIPKIPVYLGVKQLVIFSPKGCNIFVYLEGRSSKVCNKLPIDHICTLSIPLFGN
jgi:hypothetical protein